MSLQVQFLTLSLMASSGVVLGFAFDMVEVLVREFKLRRWIASILDILYWIAATLFVFRVLFYANFGQVRFFIFLGLLIGVIVYFFLFSTVMSRLFSWLVHSLIQVFRILIKVFRILFIRPLSFVYRIARIISRYLAALTIFLTKIVIQWGRSVWRMISRRS